MHIPPPCPPDQTFLFLIYFLMNILFNFIYLILFFGCAALQVGSQFDQGSNLCPPALEARSLNHWITRQVPILNLFLIFFFLWPGSAAYGILVP